jgi:hypothetical protein
MMETAQEKILFSTLFLYMTPSLYSSKYVCFLQMRNQQVKSYQTCIEESFQSHWIVIFQKCTTDLTSIKDIFRNISMTSILLLL